MTTVITCMVLLGCLGQRSLAGDSCDDVNSRTIVDHLHAVPGYPLIGFWKRDCQDDFGLAIDRAGDGEYSISFCGPGGCFEPGTYRPNSPIVGDPDYNVVDADTIEVSARDGFSTYIRCTSAAGTPAV